MGVGINTLKRTICTLLVGLVLVAGLAVPAEAQRRNRDGRGWSGRHDNGRHLGWTRGRHRGWDNRRRWNGNNRRRREWRRERRDDRRDFRRHRTLQRRSWWQNNNRNRVSYIGPAVRSNRRWNR